MNKIIPFKKEIEFNTKICEITSISLEHNIKNINNDLISGEFIIEGEYKIIEGSINKESYRHVIPFDIAIGSNYDLSNVVIDIDNFYYDVIDDKILKVNIDLSVNNIEEVIDVSVVKVVDKEEITDDKKNIDNDDEDNRVIMDEEKLEEGIGVIIPNKEEFESVEEVEENALIKEIDNNVNEEIKNEDININNINIFDNLKMEETYSTYLVYFVKESDNIDKILAKYKITKEELENYNDLSNIKVNDKLIIPTHE